VLVPQVHEPASRRVPPREVKCPVTACPQLDTLSGEDHDAATLSKGAIMDVVVWLRSLGLEEYEAAFRENKVDAAVLPKLTAEDLRDLGVAAVGDRRKLLEAIESLRSGTKPEPTPSEISSTD
jgi:hypothetical protein